MRVLKFVEQIINTIGLRRNDAPEQVEKINLSERLPDVSSSLQSKNEVAIALKQRQGQDLIRQRVGQSKKDLR